VVAAAVERRSSKSSHDSVLQPYASLMTSHVEYRISRSSAPSSLVRTHEVDSDRIVYYFSCVHTILVTEQTRL
jgi:hypothetical protein